MSNVYPNVEMRPPSLLDFPFAAIQDVVNRFKINKKMRGSGIFAIIWGALHLTMGVAAATFEPTVLVVVGLGAALIYRGIILIRRPSPQCWYLEATIFFALAGWNLWEWWQGRVPVTADALVFGIIQIAFGVFYMVKGKAYGEIVQRLSSLAPDDLAWLLAEIKNIERSKLGMRHDVIKTVVVGTKKRTWSIVWGEDYFLFMSGRSGRCEAVPRTVVTEAFAGYVHKKGRKVKIKARLWGKKTRFQFRPGEFQRLQQWLVPPVPELID